MDDNFRSRLEAVLAEQGRTQKWLAERVGVSVVTVNRWAAGSQAPSGDHLQAIARALGVPMASFTTLTGSGLDDPTRGRQGVPPQVLSALELLQRAEALIGSARILLGQTARSAEDVELGPPISLQPLDPPDVRRKRSSGDH